MAGQRQGKGMPRKTTSSMCSMASVARLSCFVTFEAPWR